MDWFANNTHVASAIANVGLLVVWIVYAHVLYQDLRSKQRPRIIIDYMRMSGDGAACVVTNLSTAPIYLECVIGVIISDDGEVAAAVGDRDLLEAHSADARELVARMRQGPMEPGELIWVGTIKEIATRAAENADDPEQQLQALKALEVRVVATMSSEDKPIGAWKRFDIEMPADGSEHIKAQRLDTVQMKTRREKRRVLAWLAAR